MRAPSLLAQCLPGLVPHDKDKASHSLSAAFERELNLPSPAVEILPPKVLHYYSTSTLQRKPRRLRFRVFWCLNNAIPSFYTMQSAHLYKYAGDNIDFNASKGRVSVADIIGFSGSESVSSKPDGYLKSCDSSIVLVNVLKHEIRDGQLSFRGKQVLELGCSYGLPGIFACLKGASTVHFQDLNAESIRCRTIPNVLANLEQARDRQSRQPESPLTPSRQIVTQSVHFYAGDWEELPSVLSVVRSDGFEATAGMNLSFSEEDFMEACSSQDGNILGQDSSSRRSRKLSGSRAWERASENEQGEGGYDIILISEIPYSLTSLKKLYALIRKCSRPPYGVVYLATKRNYVGFSGGARHLKSLVDEEGIIGAHLVKEMADRDVWKFFFK